MAALDAKAGPPGITPLPNVQSQPPETIIVDHPAGILAPSKSSVMVTPPGAPIHCNTGAMLSSTVTSVSQVEVFPFTSVTTTVKVFVPTLAQVKSILGTVGGANEANVIQ